jgi:hypothetical protein
MDFSDQSIGEREVFLQPSDSMLKGGYVIGYLHHIVQRHSRRFFQLKEEQVGE